MQNLLVYHFLPLPPPPITFPPPTPNGPERMSALILPGPLTSETSCTLKKISDQIHIQEYLRSALCCPFLCAAQLSHSPLLCFAQLGEALCVCFIHQNVPLASAVVITPEQELQILKWIGYESFLFETSGRNVVAQWQSCLLCLQKSWVQSLAAPPGWLEETIASQFRGLRH